MHCGNLDFSAAIGSFKTCLSDYSMEMNLMNYVRQMWVHIITLPCIECGIAEIASHSSQVSGLISFLNSPSHLHWEAVLAVTRPTKDCLHSSEFSGRDGENIQKLCSCGFRWTRVLPASNHYLLACFSCKTHTLCAGHSACHFWQVNYLVYVWVAFALHLLAVTFSESTRGK